MTKGSGIESCTDGRSVRGRGVARQLRMQYLGAIYHVMARGDRRQAIFDGNSGATSSVPGVLPPRDTALAGMRVSQLIAVGLFPLTRKGLNNLTQSQLLEGATQARAHGRPY